MKKRLDAVEAEIAAADPLKRLHLVQERLDLQSALEASESNVDLAQLEKDFITSAAPYSERKSISYSAWRELGVPTDVLDKAGIARGAGWNDGTDRRDRAGRRRGPAGGPRRQAVRAPAVTSSERSRGTPSVEPSSGCDARSGWGIRPTTLRPAEQMPAMSSTDPLGLST